MKKPELLVPANNLEVLKTAVIYGADAVYIGGEAYGLRAGAKNASDDDLREGIRFAHKYGKKVYVTANILAHNEDFPGLKEYFERLRDIGPDALIISDPGVFMTAKEVCPDIDIHISTQANNTNFRTFSFWHELGAKRVVAGRELSLKELKEIKKVIPEDMEIETFVHGAMCIAYSGRCLLSNFLTGRDANRGECTHPCRWKYSVMEETRPGEYFPVEENERGTFIFNSKDLNMIEHLNELIDTGTDSLKIEGRMKTALYVATTARTYRQALDDLFEDPERYRSRLNWYKEELGKCTNREYTTGFFFGKPTADDQIYDGASYVTTHIYIGSIMDTDASGRAVFMQKNKFEKGDVVEIMKPSGENILTEVLDIYNDLGEELPAASHASEILHVRFSVMPGRFDILRMRKKEQP